jgi:hypothetical protein
MNKNVTLSEILELKFDNNYHYTEIERIKEEVEKINKFYPCHVIFTISQWDEDGIIKNSLNYHSIFLDNDICKIKISKYKDQYSIHLNDNFDNVSYYSIENIKKNFKKPNNIKVLNKKKLSDWVEYWNNIYLEIKKLSDVHSDIERDFLESIKNENVSWNGDKKSGYILKNGIRYIFKIEQGYITEKLEIDWNVKNTFETFKLLSDNKINREAKLRRILK